MFETLDAAAVRGWCAVGLAALRRHEHEINELNVYPVPDGDTGTNLVGTLAAAERELWAGQVAPAVGPAAQRDPGSGGAGAGPGLVDQAGPALRLMARGALLGARGNSGVIVSQLLRGLADTLASTPGVRGGEFAAALSVAAESGYAAVAEPVEGTILSVAAAAARAATTSADAGADLVTVCRAAAGAAADALARTPGQLPALAVAGVVDAGGRGLVVLLDALVAVVAGGTAAAERPAGERPAGEAVPEPAVPEPAPGCPEPPPVRGYEYEVQYLLDAGDGAVARLRETLALLGDSLVVVGSGDGTWKVHVHVDDVGAALEAGVAAGRPHQISVTRFGDHSRRRPVTAGARGAVVVATGGGLADLFGGEGAVVVAGRASTAEVMAAVRETGADQVVVLPNDPNTQAVAAAAAAAAESAGVQVAVVPTCSPVQALAALAVRDPERRFDDDVIAMAEAAGACRYAVVCHASRDALTVAGRCRAGDVLALVEGEVHLIGADVTAVCRQLLERLLGGGGELVSLIIGAGAPAGLGEVLAAYLADVWPFVEVQVHDGGQPTYPLIVGVE